jgi:hypothetical protein
LRKKVDILRTKGIENGREIDSLKKTYDEKIFNLEADGKILNDKLTKSTDRADQLGKDM